MARIISSILTTAALLAATQVSLAQQDSAKVFGVKSIMVAPHTKLLVEFDTSFKPANDASHILISDLGPGQYAFRIVPEAVDSVVFNKYRAIALSSADGEITTIRPFDVLRNAPGLMRLNVAGGDPVTLYLHLTAYSRDTTSHPTVFDVPITWLPPVDLWATTETASCPVNICAWPGQETDVYFRGRTARFLAIGKPVAIQNGTRSLGSPQLEQGPAGVYIRTNLELNQPGIASLQFNPQIDPSYWYYDRGVRSVSIPVKAEAARATGNLPQVDFLTDDLIPLDNVVKGQTHLVRVVRKTADRKNLLQPNTTYSLVQAGDSTADVATLYVVSTNGNTARGYLNARRETELPVNKSKALLEIRSGNASAYQTELAIRPVPQLTSVQLMRGGAATDTKVLYPGENVVVRFEGPGLRWMKTVFLASESGGQGIELTPLQHTSDVVQAKILVPMNAGYHETLVLSDNSGSMLPVPFDVKPAQSPQQFKFAHLHIGKDTIPFDELPKLHREADNFRSARIDFDARSIDTAKRLYGVQYIDVAMKVLTPKREQVATHSRCYAIVPPNGGRPVRYQVDGDCAQLPDGVLELDDVLDGYVAGSVPHAVIDIVVSHQQARYPGEDAPYYHTEIERKGSFTWDWSYNLPTAVMVLGGGPLKAKKNGAVAAADSVERIKAGTLEFQPTGLVREITPYGRNGRWPVTLHLGAVVSTLFEREDKPLSRVAVPFGVSYHIVNMKRTVNLQMFVGGMFPVVGKVFKDAAVVGYPGFSINLGGGMVR